MLFTSLFLLLVWVVYIEWLNFWKTVVHQISCFSLAPCVLRFWIVHEVFWIHCSHISPSILNLVLYPFNSFSVSINASNSRMFVSGSCDSTARLWDTRVASRAVRTFHGHEGDVNSVKFFPDGNRFGTGSEDGTCRLFDIRTGHQLQVYPQQNGESDAPHVTSIAFSISGRLLFAGYSNGDCKVWDTLLAEVQGFKLLWIFISFGWYILHDTSLHVHLGDLTTFWKSLKFKAKLRPLLLYDSYLLQARVKSWGFAPCSGGSLLHQAVRIHCILVFIFPLILFRWQGFCIIVPLAIKDIRSPTLQYAWCCIGSNTRTTDTWCRKEEWFSERLLLFQPRSYYCVPKKWFMWNTCQKKGKRFTF